MIQTQVSFENAFFRALHNIEALDSDSSDLYIEAYDYVMDIVKDAILCGDVKNTEDLDNFINQADSYAEDYEPGDYADGYQDAVNVCLEALAQITQPTGV